MFEHDGKPEESTPAPSRRRRDGRFVLPHPRRAKQDGGGVRQAFLSLVSRTEIGRNIVSSQNHRVILSAAASLALNSLYAVYHGVLGVIHLSLWMIVMCAYYGFLATMRFFAVLCGKKSGFDAFGEAEYFVARLSGALLVALSIVLTAVIYVSLSQEIAAKYDEITMITIATYTFCKIAMAIVRAVKQRKNTSPLLCAIRRIGYAEVAASVLTLQRSMLVSVGAMSWEGIHTMNAATGAAVCLFVLMPGFSLIVKGRRKEEGL